MRSARRSPGAVLALGCVLALGAISVPVAFGADIGAPVVAALSPGSAAAPAADGMRGEVRTGGWISAADAPFTQPHAQGSMRADRSGRFDAVKGSPTALGGPVEEPAVGILAAYRAEAARGVSLDEARATLSRLSEEQVDGALLSEVDAALAAQTAQAAD